MIVGKYCGHETALEDTLDHSHLVGTSPEGPAIEEFVDWLELPREKRKSMPAPDLMVQAAQNRLDAEEADLYAERLAVWEKMKANTYAMEPTVPAYTDLEALEERAERAALAAALGATAVVVRGPEDKAEQQDYYVTGSLPLVAEAAPKPVAGNVPSVFDQIRQVLGPDPEAVGQTAVAGVVEVPVYAYLSAYREAA